MPGLGLGFRLWGLGFELWGLGFRVAASSDRDLAETMQCVSRDIKKGHFDAKQRPIGYWTPTLGPGFRVRVATSLL